MKKLIYLTVLALVLAPAFGGCRSKPKSRKQSKRVAQAPIAYVPPQSPGIGFDSGVPAPTPAPGPTTAEIDALHDQIETEQLARARVERDAAEASARLSEAEDEIAVLKDRLTPPAAAPEPQPNWDMPPASSPAADFADRMRATGALEVVQTGDTVTLRLSDAFRSGSDKLRGDTRLLNALRSTSDALNQNGSATIAVVGHSDTTPIKKSPWPSNTALSLARAKTVAGLLADAGVPANRIAVDGRGEFEPLITPERNSGDRARNRRVEIEVRF